jgi:hypothetical protein
MHLDTVLLALESVLLLATVILLVFSIREGRGRDALIMEVGRATRVLVRHEYFITVMDSMMDAATEVAGCITGRMPAGDDMNRTRELIMAIEKLSKAGVSVRYLLDTCCPCFRTCCTSGGSTLGPGPRFATATSSWCTTSGS